MKAKIETLEELIRQNVRGTTAVSVDTVTEVRMVKKHRETGEPNPYVGVQKVQTKNGGSSNRKGKNGNGGNGNEKDQKTDSQVVVMPSKSSPEKKRRGRAATEGEPLRRVLIFLSEQDIASLKAEVGNRGVSTKIREIIKDYLAKRD